MANDGYSRQQNPFSGDERNARILQGNNFSGTVVESLQNPQPHGPGAPDMVWGAPPRVIQGAPAPASRSRYTGLSTYEVMSPMQRAQEQMNQRNEPPVLITVRRRNTPLNIVARFEVLSEEETEIHLRECRAAFVQEYNTLTDPTLQRLLSLCAPLLNITVNIERKYVELEIWRVFEANEEKSRFLHLTQGLGILEKYASNLIKEGRPPYWRTVKFTSSLVQIHVGSLIGSRDILSQMGYTQDIDDGVSFPGNVHEPDVHRLRDLAPDLFFARYEIDALLTNNHPFYEMEPPVSQSEVQLPALMRTSFPPSRPQPFPSRTSAPLSRSQQPTAVTTGPSMTHSTVVSTGTPMTPISRNAMTPLRNAGNQASRLPSPTPAARRQRGNQSEGKENDSQPVTRVMQEPQQTAERNAESEEDSEYEDAEDGILLSNGGTQTQAQTNFECRVCGESVATKFCKDCKDTFCVPCDELYHNHRSRQCHVRSDLVLPTGSASTEQPEVGTDASTAAVAISGAGAASGTERHTQKLASSTAAVASISEESRTRPVPAPRRYKAPPPSYQGVAQATKAPELKMEDLPPPLPPRAPYATPHRQHTTPTYTPIQQSTSPRSPGISQFTAPTSPPIMTSTSAMLPCSVAGNQSVVSHPVVSTSSQAQSQGREILWPPPFDPHLNTTTQQSSQGGMDQVDNKLIVKSSRPFPPKPSGTAVPKIPVESKAASEGPGTAEKGPSSCPNCYCLNSGDATTCLFCKKPLPVKSHQEPTNQPAQTQQNEFLETRNYPAPLWALSQDQRKAASQMRQSQGNVNVIASSGAGQTTADPEKWECEHCTYHNPRTRKICEMCCKTNSNDNYPPRNSEFPTIDPSTQQVRPRETENSEQKVAPSQNFANMTMQINSQETQTTTEQTKKMDPQNLQAAPTGTPVPAAAEPVARNAFPAQGHQQTRMWEGSVRAAPTSPPGPPLTSYFPGMVSPGQAGMPNNFGMANPEVHVRSPFTGIPNYGQGGLFTVPEVPVRSQFTRDAGLPYGPQGFPPPPPMMGSLAPEIPVAGSFPAPIGNSFLQQHVSPGFPPPPLFAARTALTDEAVRRQQEEIYISGSLYVEWLKKAEKEGFTAEELNIASVLGIDDVQGPIHWLHTSWYDLIHKVLIELAVPENSQEIGNVSPEEVREALIECTGQVSRATAKCMEIRKKKVRDLQQAGVYAKTDCISALDTSEGDTEKAILTLEKMSMQPMLQRVLNSCLPDHATQDDVFMALTRQADTQSPQDKANFEAIVTDKGQNLDRRIRAILAEKDVSSWGRAETAIKLIDMDYSVEDSIEAADNCGDLQRSLRYIKQECPLCSDEKPMSQMITFLYCQDRVCQDCVSQYITITIRDKNIMHLVCPCCGKPENLDDEAVATEYFNNFDIMIRGLVEKETHDLFQRKLRDRTLMKEPNFRWCSHCASGFINEQRGQIRMMCPHCQQYTCFKCKRQWEDQHEGITCEQFAAWKEANDPEFQAAGLAAHLKMNGIVCPDCKYRYDLSKGGCMHFKCAQCPHEFCNGCYNPFLNTNAQNCHVSEHCTVRGLHAHHPRDCHFYLRDRSPEELQELLRDNNVAYNTEPPEGQGNASDDEAPGAAAAAAPLRCKVSEQQETVNGLVDGECGEEVPAGHAGLCEKHYVEYLVVLVNDNLLDPADILSADHLKRVLERGYVNPPVKPNRMNDEQYKQLLLQTVKEQLPLPPKPPRKRILDDEDEVLIVQDESDDDDDDEDHIVGGPVEGPVFDFDD